MAKPVVRIHGLEELVARFEQSPEIVEQEIDRAMKRTVQRVQADVKVLTPVDTGRLRGSITSKVAGRGTDVKGTVGTNVKYAPYVEYGTKPHFPPLGALEVWARRHGMTAFQVAIGIARKGTKARRMFEKGLKKNRGWIENEFGKVAGRIVGRLGS